MPAHYWTPSSRSSMDGSFELDFIILAGLGNPLAEAGVGVISYLQQYAVSLRGQEALKTKWRHQMIKHAPVDLAFNFDLAVKAIYKREAPFSFFWNTIEFILNANLEAPVNTFEKYQSLDPLHFPIQAHPHEYDWAKCLMVPRLVEPLPRVLQLVVLMLWPELISVLMPIFKQYSDEAVLDIRRQQRIAVNLFNAVNVKIAPHITVYNEARNARHPDSKLSLRDAYLSFAVHLVNLTLRGNNQLTIKNIRCRPEFII